MLKKADFARPQFVGFATGSFAVIVGIPSETQDAVAIRVLKNLLSNDLMVTRFLKGRSLPEILLSIASPDLLNKEMERITALRLSERAFDTGLLYDPELAEPKLFRMVREFRG